MTTPNISTRRRKALIDKISALTETEHREIFKMLKETLNENVGFTQNRNGIFINFKMVPPETVIQIEKFVEFCNSNRADLDEYDKRINECKLNKDISKVIQYTNEESTQQIKSSSLQEVLTRESENHAKKTEWMDVIKECKQKTRVTQYVESLETNFQKIHKKKTCNMKYANAKKKYARRIVVDKKFDSEGTINLEPEPYIITK